MSVTRVMFTVTSSGYGEMKNDTSSRGTRMPSACAPSHSSYSPATAVSAAALRWAGTSEVRI